MMHQHNSPGARYDSTRKAWETIWDNASVEAELETMAYARARRTTARYAAYLPKTGLILEAGSGLSAAVITLRRMGYPVIGLDYAENALHISRHYDPSLPLAAGDVHALPFGANALDAYLSFGVLEHFEQGMGAALAEACRVLKPGGVLVLTIPYPNVVHRLVHWRRGGRLNDDAFYESTYTRRALCDNAAAAGFTVVEAVPTSHAFTLWGLGGPFRGRGYYQTSALADILGGVLRVVLPWAFNFSTLLIARKPGR
jgi:SAM-dependent methyltransferase